MSGNIPIGNRQIGSGEPAFIIAEAGVNHNGSLATAKRLIDRAAAIGADAVKFQTFRAESLVTRTAEKSEYQKKNDPCTKSQFEMLKKLELSTSQFEKLSEHAGRRGILFLSTAFDPESLDFLSGLDLPAFKIPSGEITNTPYLRKVAGAKKPVLLSTGMSTLAEVKAAIGILRKNGSPKIILLHCTSSYPAPFASVNLRVLDTFRKKFRLPVGYSDHTEGIAVPVAAVALGSCVIEKHFTLDKAMEGPDHRASLDPSEFAGMVTAIRQVEQAMGSPVKQPDAVELSNRSLVRKSIVAGQNIRKGAVITETMLAMKRPGTGLGPDLVDRVVGRTARCAIQKDTLLSWDMLS
jgi:N-acetylneuraminate synthase